MLLDLSQATPSVIDHVLFIHLITHHSWRNIIMSSCALVVIPRRVVFSFIFILFVFSPFVFARSRCTTPQGGDKLTLNLSGADVVPPLITLSPNSPKTPTSSSSTSAPINPSTAALITFNTPPASPVFDMSAADASTDSILSASNVTVTHFSEQRGGVVEKISVPSLNIYSAEMSSPKLDNTTRAQQATIKSNNPFINSPASPVLKNGASTNPFLRLTEVDAENNNNSQHGANGRKVSVEEESEEDNLDVVEKVSDKNPFRGEEKKFPQLKNVKAMNVAEDKNGNRAEEIVTVNEIDGGRVAEIIRVSGRSFQCSLFAFFILYSSKKDFVVKCQSGIDCLWHFN